MASALPQNLGRRQILRFCPRLESETLEVRPRICSNTPSQQIQCPQMFYTQARVFLPVWNRPPARIGHPLSTAQEPYFECCWSDEHSNSHAVLKEHKRTNVWRHLTSYSAINGEILSCRSSIRSKQEYTQKRQSLSLKEQMLWPNQCWHPYSSSLYKQQ